jgi:DNA repair exonuclease SbcCD ATPase subunit
MIILKKLKWSNLFSYGENNEIDFTQATLTQLVGKNGHGKSSISQILELVLFNKTSKAIKKADILNRYSKAKKYTINLTFEVDGKNYEIDTVVGSTQTIKLTVDGSDISSHTASGTFKSIENILGFDHKTFCQIVNQTSSSSLEFLTATDSVRKKFLVDLFSLEVYSEALEIFKSISKELTDRSNTLTGKLTVLKNTVDNCNKQLSVPVMTSKDVPTIPEHLMLEISDSKNRQQHIVANNTRITNNNKYKELLQGIKLDLDAEEPAEVDYKERIGSIKSKILACDTTISKMSKVSNKCITCGGHIDNSKSIELLEQAKSEKSTLSSSLEELNAKFKEYTVKLDRWIKAKQNADNFEKYSNLIDQSLPETIDSVSELQETISKNEAEISRLRKVIQEAQKHNETVTSFNAKLSVYRDQLDSSSKELEIFTKELANISSELSTAQILVKAFSPTGLVAYKIEYLIKELEIEINEYLEELSDGRFSISFVINSDKLNVVIVDNGIEIEIGSLSSGELARVNVAALLGIRKILQAISSSRINLLILDETIENLDTLGKEKLVEVLLSTSDLNILLVSHSFTHPLISKLHVVKENNLSRIE